MTVNSGSVCSMKAILVISLILLVFLTFMAEGSENETFSISGSVHNDVNGNGEYDPGDTGIPNVYVWLLNSNNDTITNTDTDQNGNYFFVGLAEGDYYIKKFSGKGWEQINPNSAVANKVTLNGTNARYNPGIDFLDRRIPIEYDMSYVIADSRLAMNYMWPGVVWLFVLVFMVIVLYFTVNKLRLATQKKKYDADDNDCSCNYLLLFVLIGTTFLGWTFYIYGKPFYIIPLIGIVCLAIPLILSISADYNIGSKLDNGEIRKSIVIALTVVYIIFLAISFEKSIDEKEMNIQSYDADFTMKIDKLIDKEIMTDPNISQTMNIKAKINTNSEGLTTPEKLAANFSSNNMEVVLASKENSSKDTGRNVPLPSSSANASSEQMIPEEVMATFTKNFLYVYVLIILFYFGSRLVDEYRTSSTLEKYLADKTSVIDVSKITAARFAIGDIGAREYKETIDALGYRADKTIEVSKYALSVAFSDVEKKYNTWKESETALSEKERALKAKTGGGDIPNEVKELENLKNRLNEAKNEFDKAMEEFHKKRKELEETKLQMDKIQ